MSSKVLSGDDAGRFVPIQWKRAGLPGSMPMAPSASGTVDERPPQQEIAALQARLAQLQSEAAAREAQARQTGIQEGRLAASEELASPLEQAAARLAVEVDQLSGLRRKLRHEAEEDLVQLAVRIARRVIRRELTADPDAILGIVKAALDRVDAREILRLRVHPADEPLIRTTLEERTVPGRVEVVPDSGLERGGVIVETARGDLDAAVESQLREIERGLTDLVRRSER